LPAPVATLKKAEIIKLANTSCKAHNHTYLEHYNCYLKEVGLEKELIGFYDLEASNLDADYGMMLSYCIKPSNSKEILVGAITREDLQDNEPGHGDKRIVEQCIADLKKFDKIVTFYGARFDIPFTRTRAMVNGLEFPPYGTITHKDLYFTIKPKFKLSSNRLENACRIILGKTNKTRIEPNHWHGALQGNPKSIAYIVQHNKYDVLDLEKLYWEVEGFGRPAKNSI
jgi:uncharacterized protein YprB with RNaseH-like and TPR domain